MQKRIGLEERIPLFAARCVNVCEAIPAKRLKAGHFKNQLFRSATGVSANYAEAEECPGLTFTHLRRGFDILLKDSENTTMKIAIDEERLS